VGTEKTVKEEKGKEMSTNTLAVAIVTHEPCCFPEIGRAVEADSWNDAYAKGVKLAMSIQPEDSPVYKMIDGRAWCAENYIRDQLEKHNCWEQNKGETWYDYPCKPIEECKDALDQTTITVQIISIERY
jgi:hypothetical protein